MRYDVEVGFFLEVSQYNPEEAREVTSRVACERVLGAVSETSEEKRLAYGIPRTSQSVTVRLRVPLSARANRAEIAGSWYAIVSRFSGGRVVLLSRRGEHD